jgi:hypothetical protein
MNDKYILYVLIEHPLSVCIALTIIVASRKVNCAILVKSEIMQPINVENIVQ